MGKAPVKEYLPDHVSPPGETLLETLEALGMSQAKLALRMGRPRKTINEIIQGKAAISAETALQLEQTLGVPASYWLSHEQHYREAQARLAKEQRLAGWTSWLSEIPMKELMKRGWVPRVREKTRQVYEALRFFGVASPDAWRAIWEQEAVAFRKSPAVESHPGATAAWLRQGEIEAQTIDCATYDKQAFLDALDHIRRLTVEPPEIFQPEVDRLCASAGVAVVFVPELPKTGICGATRWLTPTKALLQLSLRYKSDDQLWFSFFHEAGHIVKHEKTAIFLECGQNGDGIEAEADAFAADLLIPRAAWRTFSTSSAARTKVGIAQFARGQGIAPGIVVGRLQHEGILPHSHCNDLKQRFRWSGDTQ